MLKKKLKKKVEKKVVIQLTVLSPAQLIFVNDVIFQIIIE